MLLGDGGDGIVLEEDGSVVGLLPLELNERGGAERRVGGDGNALLLGELDEGLLDEVGVVLYFLLELISNVPGIKLNSPIWRTEGWMRA